MSNTPAVNTNAWLTGDQITGTCKDTGAWITQNNPQQQRLLFFQDQRPQSIHSPKSASGWRAPLAWSHVGGHVKCATGDICLFRPKTATTGDRISGTGVFSDGTAVGLVGAPNWLRESAISKALLKVKNEKVSLSQNFVERNQAVRLTEDTINRIASSVALFKKKYRRDFTKALKKASLRKEGRNVPQAWLELQYGWNPLLADVHGSMEALAERESSNDTYRVTAKSTVKETFQTNGTFNGAFISAKQDWIIRGEDSVFVRLDYALDNPFLHSLVQLGVTNPAELVWEELPFSFVIDWFVPVGNYLSQFDATLGYRFLGGSLTTRSKAKRSVVGPFRPNLATDRYIVSYLTDSYGEQYRIVRETFSTSPHAGFPALKNPLRSLRHFSQAMSLLAANLRH